MLSFNIRSSMHLGSTEVAACSISVTSEILVVLSEYSDTSMRFSTAYTWK